MAKLKTAPPEVTQEGETRSLVPSNALIKATPIGVAIGSYLEWWLNSRGIPLPAGTGAAIAGLLVGALGWIARGGRKGEPH